MNRSFLVNLGSKTMVRTGCSALFYLRGLRSTLKACHLLVHNSSGFSIRRLNCINRTGEFIQLANELLRRCVVFPTLRHFSTVFSKNKTIHNNVFEGRLSEKSATQYLKRVEPTSCLVKTLGDKISREIITEGVI